jgi:hypothetical protein
MTPHVREDIRHWLIELQDGHSVFAPSASAGWLYCQDYLFANFGKADTAGEDAAYGTVGHTVGETWLTNLSMAGDHSQHALDFCEPVHLIGRTMTENGFEITIDEEMVSYVREYVEWCFAIEGDHFIETRVDFSDLTPIPKQGGRADHAVCLPGKLIITDLKMGKGIKVYAEKNTQALLYAYGFFREYDLWYDFQEIEIRIAQPRIEHFDTWTVSREELLAFAKWAKERAYLAWDGGPRAPGPKQCQWCKDIDCAARLALLHDETDDVFRDETQPYIDAEFTVISQNQMAVAKQALDDGWQPGIEEPAKLTTAQLAKLLRYRKMLEGWFSDIEAELERRALDGETIPGWKLVEGRAGRRSWSSKDDAEEWCKKNDVDLLHLYKVELLSPAQFEEIVRRELAISKKKAGQLIGSAVIRPTSRQTLAPITDEREALQGLDDVFADETLDGL